MEIIPAQSAMVVSHGEISHHISPQRFPMVFAVGNMGNHHVPSQVKSFLAAGQEVGLWHRQDIDRKQTENPTTLENTMALGWVYGGCMVN